MFGKKKKRNGKKKLEFSKQLLVQESALIWITTITFLVLAFICVFNGYFGELPWLTAMAALPWTAYGVSQAFYYRKAEKENTKNGIKYETVLRDEENNECELEEENDDLLLDDDENAHG